MRAASTWWSATVFVLMWMGFAAMLLVDADQFASADAWLRSQPIATRAVLWVFFLPVAVGLRTWTSPSAPIRVLGLVVIVGWTAASAVGLRRLLSDG